MMKLRRPWKKWSFFVKVSVSIALASLAVLSVVSVFVFVTFRHWVQEQETELLDTKLKRFEVQIGELEFLPSLLKPGWGKGSGAAVLFNPDLSVFASELGKGQRLELLDAGGTLLASAGDAAAGDRPVRYTAERNLSLLVYGTVTIRLTDRGQSASAVAEGEVGRLLLFGLFMGAALAAGAGWYVARSALQPIRGMIGAARSIGTDDLSQRLELPETRDELHQLAETFNGLLHRLEGALGRQRRFTADASHELKTPLAIIEGHAHMIRRWGGKSPEVLGESLGFIVEETGRMKELIGRLLLLAEADEPVEGTGGEACDLRSVLDELAGQTVHVNPGAQLSCCFGEDTGRHGPFAAPENGESGRRASHALPPVMRKADTGSNPLNLPSPDPAEPVRLRVLMPRSAAYQVLRNIVENALKYTPAGGSVSATVRRGEEQVVVSVSDTGIGIPPEHLPHVFDRFYRSGGPRSRSQGGSGLGLAIVKALMERYGGDIAIESAPGAGTTVTLTFPAAG